MAEIRMFSVVSSSWSVKEVKSMCGSILRLSYHQQRDTPIQMIGRKIKLGLVGGDSGLKAV